MPSFIDHAPGGRLDLLDIVGGGLQVFRKFCATFTQACGATWTIWCVSHIPSSCPHVGRPARSFAPHSALTREVLVGTLKSGLGGVSKRAPPDPFRARFDT
eukprot:411261-Prymnesium_polylepis.2